MFYQDLVTSVGEQGASVALIFKHLYLKLQVFNVQTQPD